MAEKSSWTPRLQSGSHSGQNQERLPERRRRPPLELTRSSGHYSIPPPSPLHLSLPPSQRHHRQPDGLTGQMTRKLTGLTGRFCGRLMADSESVGKSAFGLARGELATGVPPRPALTLRRCLTESGRRTNGVNGLRLGGQGVASETRPRILFAGQSLESGSSSRRVSTDRPLARSSRRVHRPLAWWRRERLDVESQRPDAAASVSLEAECQHSVSQFFTGFISSSSRREAVCLPTATRGFFPRDDGRNLVREPSAECSAAGGGGAGAGATASRPSP